MKKYFSPLKRLFVSWRFTLILLVIYAVSLSAATFIEKTQGTPVARELVYNQPFFLLAATADSGTVCSDKCTYAFVATG